MDLVSHPWKCFFFGMNSMDKPGFMGRTLLWRPLVPGWSQGGICSWIWGLEKREVMEGTLLARDCHHGVSRDGFGNLRLFPGELGQQERGTKAPAQQIPPKSSGSSRFWDEGDVDELPVSLLWRCSPSSSRVLRGSIFPLGKTPWNGQEWPRKGF